MRVLVRGSGTPVWRVALHPDESGETLLDPPGVVALSAALEEAEGDPACRVVVVEGTPGRFCGGLDLAFATSADDEAVRVEVRRFARLLSMMKGSERIILAAVDGEATGGGVGIAAAADLCLATRRASFGLPEAVLGLVPAVILPVLLERLPPQKVRLLALSDRIGGEEALGWGLVDRLLDGPQALESSLRSAIKHALRCSPRAVAHLKALTAGRTPPELMEALEAGADTTTRLLGEGEIRQALTAFLQGSSLPWFDRHHAEEPEP